jgi:argininosuccinate lyase
LLTRQSWTSFQKDEKDLLRIEEVHSSGEWRRDIHSQVEMELTTSCKEGKIHSGRSRNDQVLVDIKLYLRAEIQSLVEEVKPVFDLLLKQSERYKDHLFPGYTHFQLAMPSSFGLWFGAYAESLVDDIIMLQAAIG